ncbi:MAG: hypothetical protein ACJAZC_002134 [Cryomorphaceae bacterium]|jgi:hypothetical protein
MFSFAKKNISLAKKRNSRAFLATSSAILFLEIEFFLKPIETLTGAMA